MADIELQPDESGAFPVAAEDSKKSRPAFSRVKRELSDEELGASGVQKLLLDSLTVADAEIQRLDGFRERFHEADKLNGVLKEKLKVSAGVEIISIATLTIGAAIAGLAPSVWKVQPAGWLAIAVGIALVIAGIVAKVVSK